MDRLIRQLNWTLVVLAAIAVALVIAMWRSKPAPQKMAAGWVREIIVREDSLLARMARIESLLTNRP